MAQVVEIVNGKARMLRWAYVLHLEAKHTEEFKVSDIQNSIFSKQNFTSNRNGIIEDISLYHVVTLKMH